MWMNLLWPGKVINMCTRDFNARLTFLIVWQIVALLRFSASPTEYRNMPLAKNRSATQTICGTVRAWLRAVLCCMFGPSSLHKYLMPSLENLYLSVRYSSEKANGSALSRKTLSCLKARLSIKTSSSTTSFNRGQAIVDRKHTNL